MWQSTELCGRNGLILKDLSLCLKRKHTGVNGRQGNAQKVQEKTHQFHARKFEERLQRIISGMDSVTIEEPDVR
jgi:hypothetical protein